MYILDDVFMFRSGPYKSWTVNSTTGQDHTNPGWLIQLLVRTIQILDGKFNYWSGPYKSRSLNRSYECAHDVYTCTCVYMYMCAHVHVCTCTCVCAYTVHCSSKGDMAHSTMPATATSIVLQL